MVMIKHMKNTESPSVLHKSISKTKVAQVTVHWIWMWLYVIAASALVVIFVLPFWHARAWTHLGTKPYTLWLGFQAHVVAPVWSGEMRDQSQTSEVCTSWSHVICGNCGEYGDALLIHYILLFYSREDRKRKELAINHEIMAIHLSMVVSVPGWAHGFIMGSYVFLCVYEEEKERTWPSMWVICPAS